MGIIGGTYYDKGCRISNLVGEKTKHPRAKNLVIERKGLNTPNFYRN
jgi:hypothetical protein